jgi:hypothetical protein
VFFTAEDNTVAADRVIFNLVFDPERLGSHAGESREGTLLMKC